MPWLSTNLADAAGPIATQANAAIAQVQAGITALGLQVDAIEGKAEEAESSVSGMKNTLSALREEGFYMITLEPKTGAWDFRLDAANNEPPYEPHFYSAAVASIVLLPSMAEARDAYSTMKRLFAAPVADVSVLVPSFDPDFVPSLPLSKFTLMNDLPAAEGWDDLFESDKWKSTALGDVFSGKKTGINSKAVKAAAEGLNLFNTANSLKGRVSGLAKNLATVVDMMNKATATGTYNIVLTPGRGDYLARLQREDGAPPSDPDLVSCGFVCVAVAATLAEVTAKFATMSEVLDA